jgi:hypothetical protein
MAEIQTPPVNPDAVKAADDAQAEADRLAAERAEQLGDTVSIRFLRPLCVGGVDYSVGVHAVPRAALDTDAWFVEQHVKDGNLAPIDELATDGKPTVVTRSPARKTAKR